MNGDTIFASEIAAMKREAERDHYPESFPALPEIPGRRYTDRAFHDLEMEHVWRKTWLYAGHISQIPEQGSYLLFDKLGLSIIVVRDLSDSVQAMHNVCRHRGTALIKEKCGKLSRIVCPYHSWSYAIDGTLTTVPGEKNFACLDKNARSLLPVRCEVWRGLIFINLNDRAAPLSEFLAPIAEKTATFPLEKMKVWRTRSYAIPCNWKAVFDNFIEMYHVPVVHGHTAMNWLKPETFWINLLRHGHSCMTTERRVDNDVDLKNAGKLLHGPLPDSAPIVPGADLFFHNNAVVMPIFPNLLPGGFNPGGFPLQSQWPGRDPGHSMVETAIFGWEDAKDQDYWDVMLADIQVQVDEDLEILNSIQASFETGYFTGSVVGFLERAIYWYNEEIDRKIGRVPAEYAVKQVLAPLFPDR
jgi:phenylpropionate dioxygenase-like ring-hydroxylating dioxygenase large terminal subunit